MYLRVHIKVGDDAHLAGLQLRRQLLHRALLGVQVQSLGLGKCTLQQTCLSTCQI